MVETQRIWKPSEKCDDCGNNGVAFVHWGPLTNNEKKRLCVSCMKKRTKEYNDSH